MQNVQLFFFLKWKQLLMAEKNEVKHGCIHLNEVKKNALSKDLSDRAAHSHPHDGWVILYNINPSTCQLLLEIWGWGEIGFTASFQELSGGQMSSCINAAWNYTNWKAKGITHPNYGALTVW